MILYQENNSRGNYTYDIYIYCVQCNWISHFHKNFEFIYVLDGEFDLTVDGETQTMIKDQCAIVFPNQFHSMHTQKFVKVWIGVFSEDFIKEFSFLTSGMKGDQMCFSCTPDEKAFLKKYFLTMDEKNILSMKSSLYMLCNRYLCEVKLKQHLRSDKDTAHKVIVYVEKHFKEDITLKDIAKNLGYEYHYFSRCFKNIFHANFKTFLNSYRYDYAQNMILNTDLPLSVIAYESGFGSLRNFNRIYKQMTNSTPKQLRQKLVK